VQVLARRFSLVEVLLALQVHEVELIHQTMAFKQA